MILNNVFVKIVIRLLAITALGLTIVPSILHFNGKIDLERLNLLMAIGMFLWFITGTLWLGRKQHKDPS